MKNRVEDATKSYGMKPAEAEPQWLIIDAKGLVVGRLATKLATILMGKHKPTYTPHVACGDCIIVVNADQVRFSGAPMAHDTHPFYTAKMAKKEYERFSGYPGGRRVRTGQELLKSNPTFMLHEAVRRMLPRNKLRAVMMSRLKLYIGDSHPHQAQQPQPITLS